ncbi:MAG TPA: SRPBCC domain-containing protein [Edaphocola sp.]|nr:SRPBCC domain-containing protein [Edaphocola sp.]
MNSNLLFDFVVNKDNNTIDVIREFAAPVELVWKAWTDPEILDQWWAPRPWKSKTKFMNFRVGGRRFYAMVGPEGQEHWSVQDFTAISPKTNFKTLNAFADKDENIDTEMARSAWDLNFSERDGTTTVSIVIKHDTLADLEKYIQMGFKEGFTMCLGNLDEYLAAKH